ncbi:hypothetical protein GCM10023321_58840 [Pseudonocardia eucalypti]|uniref:Uncharacterized protein n=1 Tax=Pseudonocardia eucalypti TaxID=648755 RepID=A0ABP9QSU3_9PSEU|nr:hypothetical protein [Pseudonocardia eucalypti]
MGISASIVMIALGAILEFALPGSVLGVNLGVIGTILMVVGAIGLVVPLVVWGPWGRGARSTRHPARDAWARAVGRGVHTAVMTTGEH